MRQKLRWSMAGDNLNKTIDAARFTATFSSAGPCPRAGFGALRTPTARPPAKPPPAARDITAWRVPPQAGQRRQAGNKIIPVGGWPNPAPELLDTRTR